MKTETKKLLAGLFTTIKADEGERIVFSGEYMNRDNAEKYALYEIVSGAMHESGLTHGFSYEIGSRAVDVVADLEDMKDDDAITEAVDAIIPVYISDLMEIYQANSWAVDESREEHGSADSAKDAALAWYSLIDNMTRNIIEKLSEAEGNEAGDES